MKASDLAAVNLMHHMILIIDRAIAKLQKVVDKAAADVTLISSSGSCSTISLSRSL